MLPRSKNARNFLYQALTEIGCIVDEVNTYEIGEGDLLNKQSMEEVDVITFTSPSTVKNLISMAGIDNIKNKQCIAIGPITKNELDRHEVDSLVCDEYNIDGLVKKLLEIREE